MVSPAVTAERSNANLSTPVYLDPGTYDLYVTGFLDIQKTKPAAWGELPGIVIGSGVSITRSWRFVLFEIANYLPIPINSLFSTQAAIARKAYFKFLSKLDPYLWPYRFRRGGRQPGKKSGSTRNVC